MIAPHERKILRDIRQPTNLVTRMGSASCPFRVEILDETQCGLCMDGTELIISTFGRVMDARFPPFLNEGSRLGKNKPHRPWLFYHNAKATSSTDIQYRSPAEHSQRVTLDTSTPFGQAQLNALQSLVPKMAQCLGAPTPSSLFPHLTLKRRTFTESASPEEACFRYPYEVLGDFMTQYHDTTPTFVHTCVLTVIVIFLHMA